MRIRISITFLFLLMLNASAQDSNTDLPACRYDDLPAQNQRYEDWQITILDSIYMLDSNYAPTDLVSLSEIGIDTNIKLRSIVLDELVKLLNAANAAGNPLEIQSAYRSYDYQKSTFQYWVNQVGKQEALLTSARAGHSEHQLGTTVDFKSFGDKPAWDYADWAETNAGAWLKEHAYQFGFVMSYPKNKSAQTCYSYEPWHYRFLGVDYATAVHNSGLTPREWLWSLQDYLKKD